MPSRCNPGTILLGSVTPARAAEASGSGSAVPASSVASTPCTEAGHRREAPPSGLGRLTLCVAATCSLSCRYCYAAAGTYGGGQQGWMDERIALEAVLWAARSHGSVGHLHFFGGEPTLNPRVIDLVCEFSRRLPDMGLGRRGPTLGLTTNGLHLDERVLKMIVRHGMSVTVSVDGPREIHDALRARRDGSGSFERVVIGIHRLQDSGIEPEIECTYTAHHLRCGVRVLDLLDFFGAELGCRVVHCPPVIAPPDSPWFVRLDEVSEVYAEAVRASVLRIQGGSCALSWAVRLVRALGEPQLSPAYCPAGRSALTVATDGTVYPCFMFIGRREAAMRSAGRELGGGSPWLHDLLALGVTANDPECVRCWLQPFCFGCLGDDLARDGGRRSSTPGMAAGCDFRRTVGAALFEGIADRAARGAECGP
jgi:uncharacterized protein